MLPKTLGFADGQNRFRVAVLEEYGKELSALLLEPRRSLFADRETKQGRRWCTIPEAGHRDYFRIADRPGAIPPTDNGSTILL